ncbi:hypothetical protein MJG53_015780 [Ovis ammon polii x Ovis aries]|nr:hypothetical protein MJG53_015780 [Ovis ammon polii x Ovis aries]
MDRKRGKYVVNIEDSGNQPPLPNLTNYEAHSSAYGLTTSIDVTGDAGPNLTDVCTNTGTLGYSEFPNRESQYCQMTRNFFSDWSLWKIFLASLLASVITTAIGVLISEYRYLWSSMGDTNPFRMDGKQQQHAVDIDQNPTELLPRNPYGSNEGTPCGCRLPVVTLQPQWAAARPWSPWKTFLLCLLACLIAAALVVLLFYFVHLSKPAAGTTIVIHADGKSSHVTCLPGAAPSQGPSSLPVSQSTLLLTPGTNHSSSTPVLPTPMETTISSTLVHEVEIEDE